MKRRANETGSLKKGTRVVECEHVQRRSEWARRQRRRAALTVSRSVCAELTSRPLALRASPGRRYRRSRSREA